MFCPKCGREEPGNTTFCRGCGGRLGSPVESPRQSPEAVIMGVQCPKCRNQVDGNLAFCPHCSASMREEVIRETSWAWWLLPIFFVWMGGLGAFFAVKDKNRKKAIWLLILGIITTVLYYVVLPVLWIILVISLGGGNGY